MQKIQINHKQIRARVIKEYIGDRRAFCFSCGNATRWLSREGVNLIPIDGKILEAKTWIKPEQARLFFGEDAFNATSGALPPFLMLRISKEIKEDLDFAESGWEKAKKLYIPFGSGELIAAISYLYPAKKIVAICSRTIKAITPDKGAFVYFIINNCSDAIYVKGETLDNIYDVVKDREGIFIDTSPANG